MNQQKTREEETAGITARDNQGKEKGEEDLNSCDIGKGEMTSFGNRLNLGSKGQKEVTEKAKTSCLFCRVDSHIVNKYGKLEGKKISSLRHTELDSVMKHQDQMSGRQLEMQAWILGQTGSAESHSHIA